MAITKLKIAIFFGLFVISLADDNYVVTEEAWFDIKISNYPEKGEEYRGRFVVGLFGDAVPITAFSFQLLAKGIKLPGKKTPLSYKRSSIQLIVPDNIIQAGEIGRGTGLASAFGQEFRDENFLISHRSAGYVGMANHGKDTNGFQFYITLVPSRWIDGANVVFGKVVKGMDVIRTMGEVPVDKKTSHPKNYIFIEDCGIVGIKKKYNLTEKQIVSNDDI